MTHVLDIVGTGNLASNNAGPILAWDFLLPVMAITLYVLARPARDRLSSLLPCTGRRVASEATIGSRSATRDEPTDEGRVNERSPDGTRWMRYLWLVYLGALFFQPAFDPTAGPLDWSRPSR